MSSSLARSTRHSSIACINGKEYAFVDALLMHCRCLINGKEYEAFIDGFIHGKEYEAFVHGVVSGKEYEALCCWRH